MSDRDDVAAAERRFFDALHAADGAALDALLADDFTLVDVMSGNVVTKTDLVGAIASGLLRFAPIQLIDSQIRVHEGAAVVVGRTEMSGSFAGSAFAARSRYTHVYLRDPAGWRLEAAQGTPIQAS